MFIFYLFFCSVVDRLDSLSMHSQIWGQLETRLDSLQTDLRNDEETLHLIDTALQTGGYDSLEISSSIKDVAKVLSERHQCEANMVSSYTNYFNL